MNRRTILLAAAAAATSRTAIAQTNQMPAPSGASGQLGNAAQTYANQTAMVGGASLQMADLALRKARHNRVREFAGFEHDEQVTAAEVLKSMDPDLNPPQPPANIAAALERLKQTRPGEAFDREFVSAQIQGHETLRTTQEDYLKSGKDSAFGNTAKLLLTVIKQHLALLHDLQSEHLSAL
jgi:putative membrane protein